MDFADPVTRLAVAIGIGHRRWIAREDACEVLGARNLGMGEFADDMAGDHPAELPARLARRPYGEIIERRAGDFGMAAEMRLHLFELARQFRHQRLLARMIAQGIALADIGFPAAEHRP